MNLEKSRACSVCHVIEAAAEHSDSDTEESEFVPDTDNSDDDDEGNDSNHSESNSDDDMENLLFELSDMSNF